MWKIRKPKMGKPMTPDTTATITMIAVWLMSFDDFWMTKTIMFMMNMQTEMKMLVTKSMKYR